MEGRRGERVEEECVLFSQVTHLHKHVFFFTKNEKVGGDKLFIFCYSLSGEVERRSESLSGAFAGPMGNPLLWVLELLSPWRCLKIPLSTERSHAHIDGTQIVPVRHF